MDVDDEEIYAEAAPQFIEWGKRLRNRSRIIKDALMGKDEKWKAEYQKIHAFISRRREKQQVAPEVAGWETASSSPSGKT